MTILNAYHKHYIGKNSFEDFIGYKSCVDEITQVRYLIKHKKTPVLILFQDNLRAFHFFIAYFYHSLFATAFIFHCSFLCESFHQQFLPRMLRI